MSMPPLTAPTSASHEIPVEQFEIKLILPLFLQPVRDKNHNCVDDSLDPNTNADFLENWVSAIKGHSGSEWTEVTGTYPPLTGADAGPGYSEFCYFHPFVRNFLYVTRGDLRAWLNRPGHQSKTIDDASCNAINRNLRILERKDLKTLSVSYGMNPDSVNYCELTTDFKIESCWMYLFDTQIAMLELHLIHGKENQTVRTTRKADGGEETFPIKLNLRMVMKLQDIIRRTYSPYWSVFEPPWNEGQTKHNDTHVPSRIELKKDVASVYNSFGNFEVPMNVVSLEAAKDIVRFRKPAEGKSNEARQKLEQHCREQGIDSLLGSVDDAVEHRRYVYDHREPYTVPVWQEILTPLTPVQLQQASGKSDKSGVPLRFELIQDDRVPLMSYIAVGQPNHSVSDKYGSVSDLDNTVKGVRRITQGDWMRLAFVDDEGDSHCWPYSPDFFKADPLDGFAYDRFWHPTGKPPAQSGFHSTRWLCSGYGFSAVGDAGDQGFFTDGHAGALAHFRYHYFALTMIALFHRASLLRYKHALAEHADELLNQEEHEESRRVQSFKMKSDRLQGEIMRFRAMYWFTEVSNQVQAQELFAMFRRHLNLDAIYRDVCADSDNAAAILRRYADDRRQKASWTLTQLGVLLTITFLVTGPLGDNIKASPIFGAICIFLIAGSCVLAIAGSTVGYLGRELSRGLKLTAAWDWLESKVRTGSGERQAVNGSQQVQALDYSEIRPYPWIAPVLFWIGISLAIWRCYLGDFTPQDNEGAIDRENVSITAKEAVGASQEPASVGTLRIEFTGRPSENIDILPTAVPIDGIAVDSKHVPVLNESHSDSASIKQGDSNSPISSGSTDTPATTTDDSVPKTSVVPQPAADSPPGVDDVSSSSKADSNSASGSKVNSDTTPPQNPNSGSAPPNQDAGDGGEQ